MGIPQDQAGSKLGRDTAARSRDPSLVGARELLHSQQPGQAEVFHSPIGCFPTLGAQWQAQLSGHRAGRPLDLQGASRVQRLR